MRFLAPITNRYFQAHRYFKATASRELILPSISHFVNPQLLNTVNIFVTTEIASATHCNLEERLHEGANDETIKLLISDLCGPSPPSASHPLTRLHPKFLKLYLTRMQPPEAMPRPLHPIASSSPNRCDVPLYL